jgi:hypothetical protein
MVGWKHVEPKQLNHYVKKPLFLVQHGFNLGWIMFGILRVITILHNEIIEWSISPTSRPCL